MGPDSARLAWRCRRGMLELDLLLQGFLRQGYTALSVAERELFCELLEWSDQELQACLVFEKPSREGCFEPLIAQIRHSAAP